MRTTLRLLSLRMARELVVATLLLKECREAKLCCVDATNPRTWGLTATDPTADRIGSFVPGRAHLQNLFAALYRTTQTPALSHHERHITSSCCKDRFCLLPQGQAIRA